ncbi:MAG: NAD(P)H-dependent oxidoreductase [Ginsengibacter sp.]
MYTIISGTNRADSLTEKVAAEYARMLGEKHVDATIFSLKDFDVLHHDEHFIKVENEILFPTSKFIIVMPEYNGSFPGVLKAMIDTSDIRRAWWGKKALLTGVSTGRAGNLRGMDHLAACLHYLKMHVHYNKLPISVIDKVIDKKGRLNEDTLAAINEQLTEFINF